jgi:hypothetical protein
MFKKVDWIHLTQDCLVSIENGSLFRLEEQFYKKYPVV